MSVGCILLLLKANVQIEVQAASGLSRSNAGLALQVFDTWTDFIFKGFLD